jgi:hypothetical protein
MQINILSTIFSWRKIILLSPHHLTFLIIVIANAMVRCVAGKRTCIGRNLKDFLEKKNGVLFGFSLLSFIFFDM